MADLARPSQTDHSPTVSWRGIRLHFSPGVAAYLTGSIVLIIVGLMTVMTLVDIGAKRGDEYAALEERGRVLAIASSNVLAPSIRDVAASPRAADREAATTALGEITRVLWGQADVTYVKIFDAGGQLLIGPAQDQYPPGGIYDPRVPELAAGYRTSVEPEDGYLKMTTPTLTAAELVGYLEFGLSTARIDDEIGDLRRDRIETTLLLIAIGVGASILLANLFARPIHKLVRATEDLAGGDLDTRVERLPGREMKELGESFNRMADELQTKIRELQDSRLRIVTGQEGVRRELAEHLHGSVQGNLLAIKVEIDEFSRRTELPPEMANRLRELAAALSRITQSEIAAVSRRLYPAIIRMGLVPSIQSLLDRFVTSLSLDVHIDERLSPRAETLIEVPEPTRLAVYRITDEALTNAVKHAPKSAVAVDLRLEGNSLELLIQDDGPGFDADAASDGLGLAAIQDHAGAVGGVATVSSRPGAGTKVQARLPLQV